MGKKKKKKNFESIPTQSTLQKIKEFSAKEFFKNEYKFIIFAGILAFLSHFRIIFNDFVILDDLDTFVNSELIHNLGKTLATMDFLRITFAISYKLFGVNAMPLHTLSVVLHTAIVILAFICAYLMFNKKIAQIAAVIFAVHPVGVEAVAWLSGNTYLYSAICALATLTPYLFFKKTKNTKYLLISVGIYSLFLIFFRSPWMFLTPFMVLLIDQFIMEEKLSIEALNNWMLFIVPLGIFSIVFMSGFISRNIDKRKPETVNQEEKVTGRYQNQESLDPFKEGIFYTTYSMSRLYAFPMSLSSMYDGKPVVNPEHTIMYIVTFVYVGVGSFVFWKNKRYGILFVIMPLMIAPSYSPVKVTWYVAERYMYIGSFFYSILLAGTIVYFSKKFGGKNAGKIAFTVTGIITILFLIKTNLRINDWKDSMAFSLALTKTAPQSARTWAFLGTSYLFNGDKENALINYDKALQIDYFTNSAANNLGVMIIQDGPEMMQKRQAFDSSQVEDEAKIINGINFFNANIDARAMFLLNDYLKTHPNDVEALDAVSEIFLRNQKLDYGKQIIDRVFESGEPTQRTWSNLAYIEYTQKNYDKAEEYINNALQIDPSNQTLLQSLQIIQNAKKNRPG